MVCKLNRLTFFSILALFISIVLAENTTRGLLSRSNIKPTDVYENQWALIIGINQYPNFTPLRYAVEDAKSMKTTLMTQYGFPEKNIFLLEDHEATKNGIENAFFDLAEKTDSEDAVVVFFAGHGVTRQNKGSKEDLGYLIPIDGKMDNLTRTTLSMKSINTFSNEIPAKSMLFLVDACYGGLAAVGQYRANRELDIVKGLTKDRSRQIITAGRKDEEVIENEKWGHSAFTRVLLQGLMELKADTDQDGIILANQLYSFVHSNVLKLTDGFQTPQFNKLSSDEGEFAFIDQNILSEVFDAGLAGFGFLTIPSEPFDALIKIDDILIDKKTPLISKSLESGYHTITISKKGYKDHSDRIFIKPNLTTTVSPIMNLIEGIISFSNIPHSSNVSVNGKSIGTTPLENIVMEKGRHTIEVEIPGYEKMPPIDLYIESSTVYPITLPRLIPKTKMNALMRSAIFPGWGQHYFEEPKKSKGFGVAALLSGLFCFYNQLQYNQISSDYDKAIATYQNSLNPEAEVNHMMNMYEQLVQNEKNTSMGTYILGGVYAINLIDVFLIQPISSSDSFSEQNSKPNLKIGILPGEVSVKIGIQF